MFKVSCVMPTQPQECQFIDVIRHVIICKINVQTIKLADFIINFYSLRQKPGGAYLKSLIAQNENNHIQQNSANSLFLA